MPIVKKGGVSVGGGRQFGQPSPAGRIRPDLLGFRVDFDRDKFEQLIATKGYDVVWEKALACPYTKGPSPGDHDISCRQCRHGFLYYDPIEVRVLITGISLDENYYAYGSFEIGKVMVTMPSELRLSFWDRFTTCTAQVRYTEKLLRQRDTLRDRPRYNPTCINYLIWIDRNEVQQSYSEITDFSIDAVTGEIVWSAVNRPDADTYYSISYLHKPQYIVLDLPHLVRDSQVATPNAHVKDWAFPVQAVAQLDFSVRNQGMDVNNEDNRKNPFPDHKKGFVPGT